VSFGSVIDMPMPMVPI